MVEFFSPTSHFRDILRSLDDGPAGFEVDGEFFGISNTYGETDLLHCYKNCSPQYGVYALLSPKFKGQEFIQIAYQCSYCDHMLIKAYDVTNMKPYTVEEIMFVKHLLEDMLERIDYNVNPSKRKKIDIRTEDWKDKEFTITFKKG